MQRNILFCLTLILALALAACAPAAVETESAAEGIAEEAPVEDGEEEVSEEEAGEEEASEEADEEEEPAPAGEEVTYTIDAAASNVVWYGAKPVGARHTGTVNISEGQMTFTGEELTGSEIVIDMATIENIDLSGDDKAQLEGHLRSDDFFGVETYPTAVINIKSATPTDEAENQYLVVADLTIKESTNEIEFVTDVDVSDEMLTATADIVFDRADFDVRFGSDRFFDDLGDRLINNEVEMEIELVASS